MNTTETINYHRVGPDHITAIAATVAAGFFDDPVTQWLLPDEQHRRQVVQPMFELYVEPYLALGESYLTEDGNGAAVWMLPHQQLMTPELEHAFGSAIVDLLPAAAAERCFKLAETFARYHPDEPLYYCQFLATVPAMQSRGIGSTFLRDMLARADRDGMPAYHEATSPRNRALYERHGYVTQGEFSHRPDGVYASQPSLSPSITRARS